MFRDASIKAVLPQLFAGSPNEDGAARAKSGYQFPPFLVMERGMTLSEWAGQSVPRKPLAILSMFADCAALLATLHAAGHVHRDLKPENVLLMLQSQAWCLIDFGIAAPAGAHLRPPSLLQRCSCKSPKQEPEACGRAVWRASFQHVVQDSVLVA